MRVVRHADLYLGCALCAMLLSCCCPCASDVAWEGMACDAALPCPSFAALTSLAAVALSQLGPKGYCGTARYLAPEQLDESGHDTVAHDSAAARSGTAAARSGTAARSRTSAAHGPCARLPPTAVWATGVVLYILLSGTRRRAEPLDGVLLIPLPVRDAARAR